jgi:fumarate reductase flavoprotein subunit
MEMVQFHPTGLLAGTGTRMTGTVIEEGLRGAGGYLLNGAKERFMHNYDSRGERATRDIVSRSIYSEMRAGRGSPNGGVYIQMSHLGPEKVRKAFKGMVERCADCGFDLAGGLVEVVPTAHYMMGGLVFHPDCSTALPGLFAAGEDTGGVHGANRLGGNGVANSTVFGGIAGDTMANFIRGARHAAAPDRDAIARSIADHEQPFTNAGRGLEKVRDSLYEIMWNKVGILRNAKDLESAQGDLDGLSDQLAGIGVGDQNRAYNLTWHDWMNLRNLTEISKAVTVAAIAREDSRGAHFREDFPETRNLESSAFTTIQSVNGKMDLSWTPVKFNRVKPGETILTETV